MTHDLRRFLRALVVIGMIMLQFGVELYAQPCYSGYRHRVPIEIDNRKNAALTNYELKLSLNTSALVSTGKMQNLGQDIRFLDGLGNELSYWIKDNTINTTSTVVWVKVDSLPDYALDTIYMFYGNSSASTKSNAANTFRLVDEFNGSTLGTNWNSCGAGTVSLSGGKLRLTSNTSIAKITSKTAFAGPVIVELEGVATSGGSAILGQVNGSGNGYGVAFDGSNMQMNSITSSSCLSTTSIGSGQSGSGAGAWSFIWDGSSQKAQVSGKSLSSSGTTYSTSGNNSIALANFGAYGTMTVDYLRVRLYTPNEPAVTWGQEQNMNFTISATYGNPLCAGGTLELHVDTIAGATYSWSGPNGFKSSLQNPQITGVSTSDAGRYDITVEIPSGCASKSSSVNVNISPKAEGGTVSGTQTVCQGANSGQLSLSGHTGNVIRWDSSSSATGGWVTINNTGLNQSYTNLNRTTYFRAIVANGNCSVDSSSVAVITVTPKSEGGLVEGSDTVCAGTNSGVLTLKGYTGTVLKWETSLNGNLWSPLVNKGTNQSYTNLNQTTYYRAVVQNGNCDVVYSAPASVEVSQTTVGGTVSGSSTVCPGSDSGWLVLSGHRGEVLRWESADPGSSTWSSINNQSDSLKFNGLTSSKMFRTLVQNGACANKVSSSATVTVVSASKAGNIAGAKTVCETSNSGTLAVSGSVGSVVKWQERTGAVWSDINTTKISYDWNNLTDTTWYRVVVANSGCASDTSSETMVPVHRQSQGGYITGTNQVCSGTNTITLESKGGNGKVSEWQESATGNAPWNTSTLTGSQVSIKNLSTTTYYRAIVQNGVCKSATSSDWKVEVNAPSNAGKISKHLELCEGTNYGVIRINGITGDVVKWQKTSSPSGTWTDENLTSTGYEVQNIDQSLYVKAIVKNGACAEDTSEVGVIEVYNYSNAGDIYGGKSYCSEINAGTIEIKGATGSVLYWEVSENGGSNWNKFVTSDDAYDYKNVSKTSRFRAVVQNGVCSPSVSQEAVVEIESPSDAGKLNAGVNVVCEDENYGSIEVTGQSGEVVTWQTRTQGSSWMDVSNTSDLMIFRDLKESTDFRVIIQNKFCEPDTSLHQTIEVSRVPVAGIVMGEAGICEDVDEVKLNLAHYSGKIVGWQSSQNAVGPWIDLGSSDDTLVLIKPQNTLFYRAAVATAGCGIVRAEPFLHTVFKKTVSGKVSGTSDVCFGVNEGYLELTNATGEVVDWEKENSDGSWSSIGYDGIMYWFENLDQTANFRVVVKNGECSAVETEGSKVRVHELPQISFKYSNACAGQLVQFENTSTIAVGSIEDVQWQFSDGYTSSDQLIEKTFPVYGKYQIRLSARSDEGCEAMETKEIVVGEMPKVFFTSENGVTQNSGCLNVDVKFSDLTTYSDKVGLDYFWDFGNGDTSILQNPSVRFDQPGIYNISLKVTTRSDCYDRHEMKFTILEENKPIIGDDITASLGIGTQLSAKGAVSYRWEPAHLVSDPEIANPIATVTENTQFKVVGTDYYGCESSDSLWVLVEEDYTILPNNVITPDGNNENDVWVVRNIENYSDNKVSVYDRWGREIYTAESYKNDWGATDREGRLLMDGTYYYVIEFPEIEKVMKGAITVVRNK